MYQFLYTFFIALTNNVDNIAARIAYSIRGIKISVPINIWISVITFVISFFAAYSGTMILGFLSKQVASIIGMALLSGIGLWMILEQYIKKTDKRKEESEQEREESNFPLVVPESAETDRSKSIHFKEATLLGIALSINNIGGGLSAGIIGLNPFWVGLLSAVLNYVALWAGNYVAEVFIRWNLSRKATIVAGMILIGIGIEQVM